MAGAFDPYRTWLGIPPGQRPPDHYRLLGLPLFEDRPEAIERAADQRMADLHAPQTGEHGKAAGELLAEVAAARVCLLDPQKKAAYDRQLRATLQTRAADAPEPPPVRGKLAEQRTATVPVFDWPQSEREGTTLFIGQRRFLFPASGPLTIRCKPGEYRVRAFWTFASARRALAGAGPPTVETWAVATRRR